MSAAGEYARSVRQNLLLPPDHVPDLDPCGISRREHPLRG